MSQTFLFNLVDFISSALFVLIFVRVILSWIPSARNSITQFVWDITEPILKPFRIFNPKSSPIDFSPIIVIFAIEILKNIIERFI